MASKTSYNVKLTAQGKAKIRKAIRVAKGVSANALKYGIDTFVKEKIVQYAPSIQAEASILSRGMTAYGMRGLSGGNRFFKDDFISVREAIMQQKAIIKKKGDEILAEFGNPEWINPRIGFYWLTKVGPNSLEKRSTSDAEAGQAWKHLIEAWEYGSSGKGGIAGRGFTVIRRRKDIARGLYNLNVDSQRGKPVRAIFKQVPGRGKYNGFRMFERGAKDTRVRLISYIKGRVSMEIKVKT